jgi:hypothetical protein
MSDAKPVDVSFVDARILAAVKAAKCTVQATRKNGVKIAQITDESGKRTTVHPTYEVDFGKRQYFVTLAVDKEEGVTSKTRAAIAERTASLEKVITNYEAPMRYGPASDFGSVNPQRAAPTPTAG